MISNLTINSSKPAFNILNMDQAKNTNAYQTSIKYTPLSVLNAHKRN
jgi:hypothetical protein